MADIKKTYLGDGVYAWFDGYQIWLEVQRYDGPPEQIALEPTVFASLYEYGKSHGFKVKESD